MIFLLLGNVGYSSLKEGKGRYCLFVENELCEYFIKIQTHDAKVFNNYNFFPK